MSLPKSVWAIVFASGLVGAQALGAEQFNVFWTDSAQRYVNSTICGATESNSGCYGSETLGPFRQACAIVATPVAINDELNAKTSNRRIAVMDRGAQDGDMVNLSVFLKTTNITGSNIQSRTTLIKTVTLPVVGGPAAKCSMARNGAGFYVGTTQSANAVLLDENFSVKVLPGFSPPIPVDRITTTASGLVAVTHKNNQASGFYLYRNDGTVAMNGGGEDFVVETGNAVKLGPEWVKVISGVSQVSGAALSGEVRDMKGFSMGSLASPVVRDAWGAAVFAGGRPLSRGLASQP